MVISLRISMSSFDAYNYTESVHGNDIYMFSDVNSLLLNLPRLINNGCECFVEYGIHLRKLKALLITMRKGMKVCLFIHVNFKKN